MSGSIKKLCDLMRYWCDEGNLGYDQSNRWDIRYGGEADCSSLVYWCLWEAGFLTRPANYQSVTLYTGTLSRDLLATGEWERLPVDGNPQAGDVLLHDEKHVAVFLGDCMAYASIDENGNARGGKSGDQTGRETLTRSYYNYPWKAYLRYKGAKMGWKHDAEGWWYDNGDGTYPQNEWKMIEGYWYWFNDSGYAVTGWHSIYTQTTGREERYFFCDAESTAAPECAMLSGGTWWVGDGYYSFNSEGHLMTGAVPTDDRGRMDYTFGH